MIDWRNARRHISRVTLAITLAIAAGHVQAEGPGWTVNSVVIKLVVTADGGINVRLSPGLTSCVSNSGYGASYASVYPSHPGINRIQADLMLALANGTPVALYFSDNTCRVTEMVLGGF
jgi:hypothetical protein